MDNKINDSQKLLDLIGIDGELEILTKVMNEEYKFEKESYVLSLHAKFGNGKTTFLNQWKE